MNSDSPGRPIRIAVLVSGRGRGTNFQAILEGCRTGVIPGEVVLLVSTTPDTPVMARAQAADVPVVYLPAKSPLAAGNVDHRLEDLLLLSRVDLVCLAGFMRKVGPRVLERYSNRIMNVHPSLVPAFAGTGMYGIHVHESVIAYGAKVSGCTVQFIDEEYDSGPIILQRTVPVLDEDTPATLAARVLEQEHLGYLEAIRLFAAGALHVDGRRVRIDHAQRSTLNAQSEIT